MLVDRPALPGSTACRGLGHRSWSRRCAGGRAGDGRGLPGRPAAHQQRCWRAAGHGPAVAAGLVRGMCWRGCGLLRSCSDLPRAARAWPVDPSTRPHRSILQRPTRGQRRPPPGGQGRFARWRVLDRSFRLLVCEPAPLALDGFAVDGLPDRPIPLDELRGAAPLGRVRHPRHALTLAGRPRPGRGWGVAGRVGQALLPGIGRRVYPLCRAFPRLAPDLEAEALGRPAPGRAELAAGGGPGPDPAEVWAAAFAAPIGCCAARPRWLGGRPAWGCGWSRRHGRQPTGSCCSPRPSGPGCCREPTPS